MNNAILFFYNINIQEIKKINNNYYFTYLNNHYVVEPFIRDITEIESIYRINLEIIQRGLIGYEIIVTKDNNLLFIYEGHYYILMKFPLVNNRKITYEDVISFNFNIDFSKYPRLDKSNWSYNWSNKIDFIEKQFSEVKHKYPLIDDSINYFIGIWENGISYYNNNVTLSNLKCVCHKRIYADMDLFEFLNPLNFVIDYKERDIGEYIKSFVLNNNYTTDKIDSFLNGFKRDNIILLIDRLLFPSYYFDLYENIILDNLEEENLNKIINKKDNITNLIKYIFNRFSDSNIPYINWIK